MRKFLILLAHALLAWVACAATMGIAMALLPEARAIAIHAAGAPLIGAGVAWLYYRRPGRVPPLAAAAVVVGLILALDAGLVGALILRDLSMFTSFWGLWLPVSSIFVTILLVGRWRAARRGERSAAPTLHSSAAAGSSTGR